MPKNSRRQLWAQKIKGQSNSSNQPPPILRKPYSGNILGIDPSLRGTGLALLSISNSKEIILHQSKTIRLHNSITFPNCLASISNSITEILSLMPVQHVAIEQTIYVQNFQTAQTLGAARGAAIAAAAIQNIPVHEYPPLRIKQAVVGYGRASKDQIAKTIMNFLDHSQPLPSDESDAAAAALCHAFTWKG